MIKAVRGTRDLLPPETALWNHVESVVRDVFRAYNFQEIRTPIFEETQLFARGVGEETDIVSKEMYTWEDRGARASDTGSPSPCAPKTPPAWFAPTSSTSSEIAACNKLYYIGPQFRRERPQKGRYRQFYQIGAEVIGPATSGSESPARDAEVLEMLATLLDRLGIKNWNLQLNSVGSSSDRARYNDALREALEPVKDKMCADCQRRAVTNPLRVLDCKVPEDQPIIETLPRIYDYLDEACKKHFEEVNGDSGRLSACRSKSIIAWCADSTTTRARPSSSRTARWARRTRCLAAAATTDLLKLLGGPQPAPGIGFAIGEDRLVLALQESAERRAAEA